jgi:hypothetical protein|tara:strand:+ start:5524 stop:7221 length:1698 start_codon:yes stop_codon:yes gene_type:complete
MNEFERVNRRRHALKLERSSFDAHWKNLAEFIQPRRGRFFVEDRNKGDKRFNNIINSAGTRALRTAVAGLLNGIMSPSRPWLVLQDDFDPELMKFPPAKQWFYDVQEMMRRVHDDAQLYQAAPVMIGEELLFGTGCMSQEDDLETLALFKAHTVGSYSIAQDERHMVNTVAREFQMTTEQIMRKFVTNPREIGDNISRTVRDSYDRGDYDVWHDVSQHADENPRFIIGSVRPRERRFRSIYYEPGRPVSDNKFLSERGFEEFPFFCPRWATTGMDVYGTECPGMVALGDVRQLQLEERRKAQGIDKMVNPPLQGPPGLRNVQVANISGGLTIFDAGGDQRGLRPVYEVRPQLNELMLDIEKVEGRIDSSFFVDLFFAISSMEGVQPRNQLELTRRDQERLGQLGPVLERQNTELLDPIVQRTFGQMTRVRGMLPPAPPEIQGHPIRIRFVSVLALAMQAFTTGNIERLAGFAGDLAKMGFEAALEKFDAETAMEEYSTLIGTPPQLIVPQEILEQARQEALAEQQRQQQADRAEQMANAAATAGNIELTDETVAGRMVDQAQGRA